ncbi:unnamed protein product [Allacma fusca]|uniref:RWD domain-containing protein n=1 Tax=Allacma fusca TaxID=39272 RepID=A0A8J2J8L2_9HEXA|nr:unnamed protein product [Allacma fusca]
MDYAEEQQSEIEALESIYPNEFTLISSEPFVVTITVKSEGFDNDQGLNCLLKFTLPPNYPDEVPEIEIPENDEEAKDEEDVTNLDEEELETLRERLVSEAQDNTGMAMVFTLVSSALEWLNVRWDQKIKEEEEAAERRLREEEEAEQQRFEGTRVTVQTFIAWKTTFDAEMKKKRELEGEKEKDKSGKLTGRELFLTDKTLNESDLQFAEEGDADALTIDESLFEDLDDLDIEDDEDEEDED